MALKNVRLARAENLSQEIRKEFKLPSLGLVIIESLNPDLKQNFIAIKDGGIREYLRSKGDFLEAEIDD